MGSIGRYLLQGVNYFLFMAIVWYFSIAPPYRQLEENQAVITLAFAHAGERVQECKRLSPEELAKLPPNMRKPMDCPRERSPVTVSLLLNGEPVFNETADAPGLYKDQGIDVYRTIKVPAGEHKLTVQMNDNVRIKGPVYNHEQQVAIKPSQLLVIDFDSISKKFIVK